MMTSKARVHMVDLMEMPCLSNDQTVGELIIRKCLKTGNGNTSRLLTFRFY